MRIKKGLGKILSLIVCVSLIQGIKINNVNAEVNPTKTVKRIQGTDRFKTSIAITEEMANASLDNVVIASAYDFPDALSGSTLAKKLNASLLLVGKLEDSKEVLDYISSHLKVNGKVYILGGKGVVNEDIKTTLTAKGYGVERLSGENRLETCNAIVENMNIAEGTPVFIASASGFADALSVSSIAAIKGYPILLTYSNELSDIMKAQITKIKPSKVYVVGGTGVISESVENQIKNLVSSAELNRLSGGDRYETSMNVYNHFNLQSKNIVLASGKNFPDALSGSLLAAKLNSSIVLSDEDNLDIQQSSFDQKDVENFYVLGGTGALSGNVERVINFDRDKEINDIKAVFNKGAKAINNKNLDEYMSTMDNTIPGYEVTRDTYEEIFSYDNIHLTMEFKDIEAKEISYKNAVVKVLEVVTAKNDDNNLTKTINANSEYKLRIINGEWKIYDYTKLD